MAARISASDIRAILDTSLGDGDLNVFADAAHLFVEERLAGTNVGESLRKELERYVAAHMIAMTRERQESQAAVGNISVSYALKAGEGLRATTYGQMAIALDVSGKLAVAGKLPAMFRVYGESRC